MTAALSAYNTQEALYLANRNEANKAMLSSLYVRAANSGLTAAEAEDLRKRWNNLPAINSGVNIVSPAPLSSYVATVLDGLATPPVTQIVVPPTPALGVVNTEATNINSGKPVSLSGSGVADAIAFSQTNPDPDPVQTMAPPVQTKWYADQSTLMKIALVGIVVYFLWKRYF